VYEATPNLGTGKQRKEPKNERKRRAIMPSSSEKKTTKWPSWPPSIETELENGETVEFPGPP
jgi:hypothetical protein